MALLTYNHHNLRPLAQVNHEEAQKIGQLQQDCTSSETSKCRWMFNRGRWFEGMLEICGLHVARAMRNYHTIGFLQERSLADFSNPTFDIDVKEEPPIHPGCFAYKPEDTKGTSFTIPVADGFEPPVEYTPGSEDNGEGLEDEGLVYYPRKCEYCNTSWYSPSCKHDYTQYPCPNCERAPYPVSMGHAIQWVKGECGCEGVRGDELELDEDEEDIDRDADDEDGG